MAVLLSCLVAAVAFGAETAAESSPLEKLRTRSAEARWEKVRSRWTPVDAIEQEELAPEPAPRTPFSAEPFPSSVSESEGPVRTALPDSPAEAVDITPNPAETAWKARRPNSPSLRQVDVPQSESAPAAPITKPLSLPKLPTGNLSSLRSETAPSAPTATAPAAPDEFLQFAPPAAWLDAQRDVVLNLFDDPDSTRNGGPSGQAETESGLRPIEMIQPFRDYNPDGGDVCNMLCPRPDRCKENEDFKCPPPYDFAEVGSTDRLFPHLDYHWMASNLHHNPLYFEDPTLERYGHVHHNDLVQPFVSMGRFGVRLASLPYQMALDPACKRQYALGWYRPGDPAPKLHYQIPWNAKATATAAGVYTGLFFLVP